MTRAFALLLAALAMLLPGSGALAQNYASGARVVSTTTWVEEWDPVTRQWVPVADAPADTGPAIFGPVVTTSETRAGPVTNTVTVTETVSEEPVRFIVAAPRPELYAAGIARFGPFRVLDGKHAALVAVTDAGSPADFAAMLAAFPELQVIEFLDAPGTSHDIANLKVGRAIRAAGLATHIPAGGSARSGAVELFLAGTRRTVDEGALFAVHSWRDEKGREPADFAEDAPENRLYLDYYAEMGMSPNQARAFYAMTNSVPHAGAKWMQGEEMAQWIAPEPAARMIDARLESGLRVAVARSGGLLAEIVGMRPSTGSGRASLALNDLTTSLILSLSKDAHPIAFDALCPPTLAFAQPGANAGAGLLDSWSAFP